MDSYHVGWLRSGNGIHLLPELGHSIRKRLMPVSKGILQATMLLDRFGTRPLIHPTTPAPTDKVRPDEGLIIDILKTIRRHAEICALRTERIGHLRRQRN